MAKEFPEWVDPWKVAEGRRIFEGTIPLARLTRLQPLLADGEAYRPLAVELTAVLAIKQSDPERARGLLESLAADPLASPAQQARARELAAALSQ
mgnify:CR=1 FL=1